MKYSTALVLYGLFSACLAPIVIHKIGNHRIAFGCLFGLAVFASFPLRKLLGIEDFLPSAAIQLIYLAVFFVIGFGWKRSWR